MYKVMTFVLLKQMLNLHYYLIFMLYYNVIEIIFLLFK